MNCYWLVLKPMVTKEEHTERLTKFVAEKNTSRRRRRIKRALFDATSCKSWKSSFTFPFAALVQF
jgi:hypothetical protein